MLREVKGKKKAPKEGDASKVDTAPAPVSKVKDQVEPCDLCAHEANPMEQVSAAARAGIARTHSQSKRARAREGGRARAPRSPSPDWRRRRSAARSFCTTIVVCPFPQAETSKRSPQAFNLQHLSHDQKNKTNLQTKPPKTHRRSTITNPATRRKHQNTKTQKTPKPKTQKPKTKRAPRSAAPSAAPPGSAAAASTTRRASTATNAPARSPRAAR